MRRRRALTLLVALVPAILVPAVAGCADQPAPEGPDATEPDAALPETTGPDSTGSDVAGADVEATRRALDERAQRAPDAVTSWGIEPSTGLVRVDVAGERDAAVDEFLAGLDPRTLRVVTGTEPVRLFPG